MVTKRMRLTLPLTVDMCGIKTIINLTGSIMTDSTDPKELWRKLGVHGQMPDSIYLTNLFWTSLHLWINHRNRLLSQASHPLLPIPLLHTIKCLFAATRGSCPVRTALTFTTAANSAQLMDVPITTLAPHAMVNTQRIYVKGVSDNNNTVMYQNREAIISQDSNSRHPCGSTRHINSHSINNISPPINNHIFTTTLKQDMQDNKIPLSGSQDLDIPNSTLKGRVNSNMETSLPTPIKTKHLKYHLEGYEDSNYVINGFEKGFLRLDGMAQFIPLQNRMQK